MVREEMPTEADLLEAKDPNNPGRKIVLTLDLPWLEGNQDKLSESRR